LGAPHPDSPALRCLSQNCIEPLDSFKTDESLEAGDIASYAFLEDQRAAGLRIALRDLDDGLPAELDPSLESLLKAHWEVVHKDNRQANPTPALVGLEAEVEGGSGVRIDNPVSVILAHKNMMHEHSGPKGMVADVPPLRDRRLKYAECMEEVESGVDDAGLWAGITTWLGRYVKGVVNTKWNEFPLLVTELRNIEGNFGSGVGSYFRFLRWVILLNLCLALLWLGFVVIPWVLDPPEGEGVAYFNLVAWFTGNGLEATWLFYGGIPASRTLHFFGGAKYDMAFAYSCANVGMFVVSLYCIIERIFIERARSGGDLVPTRYCSTMFEQMDLTVTSQSTQATLSKGYANQAHVLIAEENARADLQKKMADFWTQFEFYVRRGSGLLLTVLTFVLAVVLIAAAVQQGDAITAKFAYGVPLIFAIVKQLLPIFLNLSVSIENRDSIEEVIQISVSRVYVFKMFNLGIMIWETNNKVKAGTLGSGTDCVETEIGKVFYNAMLMDMFVVGATVVLSSYALYWLAGLDEEPDLDGKPKDPRTEFNHELVGNNVIDLMFRQGQIWCGAMLSPVLCFWGSLMNFVIFQLQMRTYLVTHRPPEKAWGANDANMFFLCLLLLTLCVATVPFINFQNSSVHCGPYAGLSSPQAAIGNFLDTVPDVKKLMETFFQPMFLLGIIVLQQIWLKSGNSEFAAAHRKLVQTTEEWVREKEDREKMMRRCLEAGMSKEQLESGTKQKDLNEELNED